MGLAAVLVSLRARGGHTLVIYFVPAQRELMLHLAGAEKFGLGQERRAWNRTSSSERIDPWP